MKFSIRSLLGLTLITALSITGVLQKLEVSRLEYQIQLQSARHDRQQKSIRQLNPRYTKKLIDLCEQVLPDTEIGSETIVAARRLYQQRTGEADVD